MRLPEWDNKFMRWDQYEAFHMGAKRNQLVATSNYVCPTFVIFDDGQLWCRKTKPDPDERGLYTMFNVSLVATGDKDCPQFKTPDGEIVKKAWLNDGGQQYLLVDHDSERVVRLASFGGKIKTTVPCHQEAVGAWFASDKDLPVGAPIAISKPFKTVPPEDQQRLDDFVCSTRAVMQLLGHPSSKLIEHHYPASTHVNPVTGISRATPARTWKDAPPVNKLAIERALGVSSWEELSDMELKWLFFAGIADRPRQPVDYLLLA